MHLNLTYEYTCGFPFCYDQGMYGLDAPTALFDTILDDFYDNYHHSKKVDVILILGDFIRHGLFKNNSNSTNWSKLKIIVQTGVDKVKARFPDTPIIFAYGNNDVLHHY